MSYSLDVNLLLYASDRESPRYAAARKFLASCTTGPDLLCLAWPTLMSYLRIATHPKIFQAPLTPEEALGNLAALLRLPHVRAISEMDGFMEAYQRVTAGAVFRGNLVPDAHLAAILLQHGVRILYSNDRDFRKFDTVELRDPFAQTWPR